MVYTAQTNLAEVKKIASEIKKAVNSRYKLLEIEVDGLYKSMLLLQKKKYAALTVTERGKDLVVEKECKGLDLVRRDWCQLSKIAGK